MTRHPRRLLSVLAVSVVTALVVAGCLPPPVGNGPDQGRARVFAGLGAWWDVWDWSPTFTGGAASLGPADVDRLADLGVQTLFVQPATWRHPATMLDPERLRAIVDRAHARGVRVVGWYLPRFVDVGHALHRLSAIGHFGFDGLAVDIEARDNVDPAARTEALLAETNFLRAGFPSLPMAAIPVTPVIWEQLNRSWWPGFPYRELSRFYDAWMPMAYSSLRSAESGWRDPYRYTVESVRRLRALTGRPDLPVHPVGGEADGLSAADVDAFARAVADTGAIGGSIYDARITSPDLYPSLQQLRRPVK